MDGHDQGKLSADPWRAFQFDATAEQGGQLLAEVETQAAALVPPAGGIDLLEGLEQAGLVFGPDADAGVTDGEPDDWLLAVSRG